MSGGGSGNDAKKECGLTQLVIFLIAIISGTACSLCSKFMMELHSVGMTGEVELFEKPIFQTFGMFIGMTFGIIMHWMVLALKIPFPGYDHVRGGDDVEQDEDGAVDGAAKKLSERRAKRDAVPPSPNGVEMPASPRHVKETDLLIPPRNGTAPYGTDSSGLSFGTSSSNGNVNGNGAIPLPLAPTRSESDSNASSKGSKGNETPLWMYFFLSIPSIFDLAATALCMMGLRYLDASIYQMLRGSGIVFVAIMKQHVLGDALHRYQWAGVWWNVVSVVLVGCTAMLATSERAAEAAMVADDFDGGEEISRGAGHAFLGVAFMMAGAFVQALQFVFEEKVMAMDDAAVSPLLLIGMEGVWGTALCLMVVYPICYLLPGSDHGSFESLRNTFVMISNSDTIKWSFAVYFVAIFMYNLFAVLVTFMLSSVWHAILDNFRPMTVWATDLFIYYAITAGEHGEPWSKWSYLQLVGMAVLLFGTAVYNAPNAGSIQLRGPFWAALGMDYTEEYLEVEAERRDAELDAKWEAAQEKFRKGRTNSSFMGERSPMVSVHTQTLRGLGSPKM